MIGILLGMAVASAAGGVWIVLASFVYCRLSGHMDLFVFPFDQWLDIAPYWQANGWTKAYVVASALAACAPFGLVGLVVFRLHKQGRLPLYGKTGWANNQQMRAGGITTNTKPF